jgi:hypothetical protein
MENGARTCYKRAMAKKPFLKTKITRDKFIVELDLKTVLAVGEAANRIYRKSNREDPTMGLPQYRITNPKKLFPFVAKSLLHPSPRTDNEPLSKVFRFAIEDAICIAAGRGIGAVEEPDPNCPVSVAMYPARR